MVVPQQDKQLVYIYIYICIFIEIVCRSNYFLFHSCAYSAFTDFCYTLNLDSNKWVSQTIDTVGVVSAPRFAHSGTVPIARNNTFNNC